VFPQSPVQYEQQLIPTLHLLPCFLRGISGCWRVQDRSNKKDNVTCFSFRFAREGILEEREVMGLGLTWRELLDTVQYILVEVEEKIFRKCAQSLVITQ